MFNKINGKLTERFPFLHSIRAKVNSAVAICGVLLLIFSLWLLTDSMNYVEHDLMNDRLAADIRYLRSMLGEDAQSQWSEKDGALYLGDTLIGDGYSWNANLEPFAKCESISDTFFSAFVHTENDSQLKWIEAGGYQQGHYQRVAATSDTIDVKKIIGTYIDKEVADKLEASESGVYIVNANVNGTMVYCRYELLRDADGKIVGIISDGRSVNEMNSLISKQKTRGIILIILAMVLISAALGYIVTNMLSAIKSINKRLNTIATGEFPEKPLDVDTHDELSDVAQCVNDMVESLKEKDRIGMELSLATDIQAHMLPSIFPAFPEHNEFDIYATMDPAKEVGGDFYDFFMLDDQHLAIVIADVSGKGVPAALFMVIAKTLIKNHAQSGLSPAEVFTRVNQMLCEGNEAGLFVTAWMGELELTTGKLTYVNAGHNPPLIKLADGGFTYLKSRAGFVLAGIDAMRYKQNELMMHPGDRLFLYTDGITEATDNNDELYGEERLADYLNAHPSDSVRDVLKGLRSDIDAFVGEAEQFDDMTMLILEYQRAGENDFVTEREFDASIDVLHDVTDYVEEELEKLECSPKTIMQMTVAVEEIFVNIANYAYYGKPGKARLTVSTDEGSVILRFFDHGMPFDPLSKNDPDISLSAEERKIGGLGIYMVRKSMDEVKYKYENEMNILTLMKRLE